MFINDDVKGYMPLRASISEQMLEKVLNARNTKRYAETVNVISRILSEK